MTAFVLKVIASVCMLIDHTGAVFSAYTPFGFRVIGRVAFPIYAYMIAQGCRYTKNIDKYLLRLGIFALVSEVPFDLAFHTDYLMDGTTRYNINFLSDTNVFYTLFLGAACVAIYEKLKFKKMNWLALLTIPIIPLAVIIINLFSLTPAGMIISTTSILCVTGLICLANFLPDVNDKGEITFARKIIPFLAAIPLVFAAAFLSTDYDVAGVSMIFLLYLAKPEKKLMRSIVLTAGIAYIYGKNLISTYGNFINDQFVVTARTLNPYALAFLCAALVAVLLLLFYNGKQGPKVKWAFYAFYPAHIAILAAVWFIAFA